MSPFIYGLVIIPVVVVMAVMGYRMIKRLRDKVDRGDATWDDEWDPFQ